MSTSDKIQLPPIKSSYLLSLLLEDWQEWLAHAHDPNNWKASTCMQLYPICTPKVLPLVAITLEEQSMSGSASHSSTLQAKLDLMESSTEVYELNATETKDSQSILPFGALRARLVKSPVHMHDQPSTILHINKSDKPAPSVSTTYCRG